MHHRRECWLALVLGLVACDGLASPARGAAVLPLPPDAQKSVDAGKTADTKGDFLGAVGHFQQALRVEPNSIEVLFYLGVEEAKLPGRELRAIAWFASYLALRTDAPNAAAVRRQITQLQQSHRQTLEQILGRLPAVIAAASRSDASGRLQSLAVDYAELGNFSAAMQTVTNLENLPKEQSLTLVDVARRQADAGNVDEARRLLRAALDNLGRLRDAADKNLVRSVVVDRQIEYRDFSGALTTGSALDDEQNRRYKLSKLVGEQIAASDLIGALASAQAMPASPARDAAISKVASARIAYGNYAEAERIATALDAEERETLLVETAEHQAEAGKIADALATLGRIEQSGRDDRARSAVHLAIAKAHLGRGATTEARSSLNLALSAALAITNAESKDYALLSLASVQSELDLPGALQVAGRIANEYRKADATSLIAESQAKRGDFTGALKTAGATGNPDPHKTRDYTLIEIARLQAEKRDFAGARQTAARIEDRSAATDAKNKIFHAQLAAGDINGAWETIGTPEDPWARRAAEKAVTEAEVKRGNGAPYWQKMLADTDPENMDALGFPLLVDLPGQLRVMASSTDAEKNYFAFARAYTRLELAGRIVKELLDVQLGKP